MREIKMNQITIDGETYPIYCDLLVLEKIQEEYESVNQFERELLGYEILRDEKGEPLRAEDGTLLMAAKEPKMKAIMLGLALMINEGIRIDNRQTGACRVYIEKDYLAEVNDRPYSELSEILHAEFNRCFAVKKKDSKTAQTMKKKTHK